MKACVDEKIKGSLTRARKAKIIKCDYVMLKEFCKAIKQQNEKANW